MLSWIFLILMSLRLAGASSQMEQKVNLVPGWNAVFVEVQPVDDAPEVVFAGAPIEMCAVWIPSKARVESLTDADAAPEKATEWSTWQPASSPSAFLNNLFAIQARTAMLIKASEATTLTLVGEPVFERLEWVAPSFNLTGFDVDADRPPTFARFFEGSRAHAEMKIFKLAGGKWKKVVPAETIRRGEAYWVWCKEGSDFQGPVNLSVALSGAGCLTLANGSPAIPVRVRAQGSLPVTLELFATGDLPLFWALGREAPQAFPGASLELSAQRPTSFSIGRRLDLGEPNDATLVEMRGGGMHYRLLVRTAE